MSTHSIPSTSPDFAFTASDFRRLLPRDRVNLVGSVVVEPESAGASGEGGEGAADTAKNLLSAAAWDDLRGKLQDAEREKEELEWKVALEADQLKRKLEESRKSEYELKKQLKRVVPGSSKYTMRVYVTSSYNLPNFHT